MDKIVLSRTKSPVPFRQIDESEPEWFYRLRRDGWNNYHTSDIPIRASQLWRYTDPAKFEIEKLLPSEFALPSIGNGDNGGPAAEKGELEKNFRITSELKEKGVIFKDLFSAVRMNAALVGKYLGQHTGGDFGRYEALNIALWNRGWFLYIPDNTVVKDPINIKSILHGPYEFRRLLIVVGDNSEATIVDDYLPSEQADNRQYNCVIDLFAGNAANLKYVNLQRANNEARGLVTYRAVIGRDTNLQSIFGGFGGSTVKVNAGVKIDGRGANSRMDGIVFADRKQHFDYHTRHHHTAGDTYSDLDFKVVLKDKSDSAYTGLIRIEKDALNCEAYQENRNLLLNRGARAESIPELEILTDEVRCTHGATMGPIDPEMIFYLRSRGFNRNEAVTAVVEGFVNSILDRVPDNVGQIFREAVAAKLGTD